MSSIHSNELVEKFVHEWSEGKRAIFISSEYWNYC